MLHRPWVPSGTGTTTDLQLWRQNLLLSGGRRQQLRRGFTQLGEGDGGLAPWGPHGHSQSVMPHGAGAPSRQFLSLSCSGRGGGVTPGELKSPGEP